jgi:hypothetical protein
MVHTAVLNQLVILSKWRMICAKVEKPQGSARYFVPQDDLYRESIRKKPPHTLDQKIPLHPTLLKGEGEASTFRFPPDVFLQEIPDDEYQE